MEPEEKIIMYFRSNLLNWYKQNSRNFPWRNTENPYHILISEVLLQRTQVNQMIPVYNSFIYYYPDIFYLDKGILNEIEGLLKPLGLSKKARYLKSLANILVQNYDSAIPNKQEELLSLPGIGLYTANAILSFAYSQPFAVVDSTVIRVFNRFFDARYLRNKPDNKIMQLAKKLLDETSSKTYNYAILDFAAIVCNKIQPDCFRCPIYDNCIFSNCHKEN